LNSIVGVHEAFTRQAWERTYICLLPKLGGGVEGSCTAMQAEGRGPEINWSTTIIIGGRERICGGGEDLGTKIIKRFTNINLVSTKGTRGSPYRMQSRI